MARKVIELLVDDLDGTELEPGDGDTVTFALDGVSYEIDLTGANAQLFRELIAPYITAGRRSGRTTALPKTGRPAPDSERLRAIREWAKANGYRVAERGRIAADIQAAFDAAN